MGFASNLYSVESLPSLPSPLNPRDAPDGTILSSGLHHSPPGDTQHLLISFHLLTSPPGLPSPTLLLCMSASACPLSPETHVWASSRRPWEGGVRTRGNPSCCTWRRRPEPAQVRLWGAAGMQGVGERDRCQLGHWAETAGRDILSSWRSVFSTRRLSSFT